MHNLLNPFVDVILDGSITIMHKPIKEMEETILFNGASKVNNGGNK